MVYLIKKRKRKKIQKQLTDDVLNFLTCNKKKEEDNTSLMHILDKTK